MKKSHIIFLFLSAFLHAYAKVGVYEVPYNNLIWWPKDYEEFTVVDANHDGDCWDPLGYEYCGRFRSHSRRRNADDWLFTAGIRLESGQAYLFNLMAMINNVEHPAKLEVLAGESPEVEAMNIIVLDTFDVVKCGLRPFENTCFYMEESGVYYFGIHDVSDRGASVEVYEVNVEKGIVPESPNHVTLLEVIPDPVGHRTAEIRFKAPKLTIKGKKLPAGTRIDYTIDGEYVGSSDPAEMVSFEVEREESGEHEFRIVPFVDGNPGPKSKCSAYVGVDWPSAPRNLRAWQVPEGIYFEWDPVDSVGYQGKPVIREEVWYAIVQDWYGGFPIVQNLMNKTSYLLIRDFSDWEGPFRFKVASFNEKGMGEFSNSVTVDFDPSLQSISSVTTDASDYDILDLQGRQQSELKPGLNIIRKEGTAIKIWK